MSTQFESFKMFYTFINQNYYTTLYHKTFYAFTIKI